MVALAIRCQVSAIETRQEFAAMTLEQPRPEGTHHLIADTWYLKACLAYWSPSALPAWERSVTTLV